MRLRGGRVSTNTLRLPRRGCSAARRRKSGASWKKNLPGVQKKAGAWLGGVKGEALHVAASELAERVSTAGFCSPGLCSRVRMPSPQKLSLLGRSGTVPSSSPGAASGGAAGLALPSPRPPFPLIATSPSEQPLLSAFL